MNNAPRRFAGRTAIVTGAGSGIGASVALRLALEGAAIGAFDIDGDASIRTAEQIIGQGGRAVALAGDTRNRNDVRAAVAATVERFGRLDALAPIAGDIRVGGTAAVTDDDWSVVETNVRGPFLFVQESISELGRQDVSSIALAASVMAFASSSGAALYSASKGAIVSMMHALAIELAPQGIRVNAVAPGLVRTPMLRRRAAEAAPADEDAALDSWGGRSLSGRLIEADEIAAVFAFLLSDEASAVTGSCYVADSGLMARLP